MVLNLMAQVLLLNSGHCLKEVREGCKLALNLMAQVLLLNSVHCLKEVPEVLKSELNLVQTCRNHTSAVPPSIVSKVSPD